MSLKKEVSEIHIFLWDRRAYTSIKYESKIYKEWKDCRPNDTLKNKELIKRKKKKDGKNKI